MPTTFCGSAGTKLFCSLDQERQKSPNRVCSPATVYGAAYRAISYSGVVSNRPQKANNLATPIGI